MQDENYLFCFYFRVYVHPVHPASSRSLWLVRRLLRWWRRGGPTCRWWRLHDHGSPCPTDAYQIRLVQHTVSENTSSHTEADWAEVGIWMNIKFIFFISMLMNLTYLYISNKTTKNQVSSLSVFKYVLPSMQSCICKTPYNTLNSIWIYNNCCV